MIAGCGSQAQFREAQDLEAKGKGYEAWLKYQEFAAAHSAHQRAPEALFRAGWLAQMNMKDCFAARTFYGRVLERYPQSDPWAKAAKLQKFNCPDFFPLIKGSKWVEGDIETKGEIARTEIVCKALSGDEAGLPSEKGRLHQTFYAGNKKFRASSIIYKKANGQLLQFNNQNDPRSKIILKWPIEKGKKWKTKSGGKIYRYVIVATNLTIRVEAGEFTDVIKVGSYVDGAPRSLSNEYYAPGVGRILKTVSTGKKENRVLELISYDLPPWPEFGREKEGES